MGGPLKEDGKWGRIHKNRRILWDAMLRHGFTMIDSEWWHFTLANEPYPDTYFDFPIRWFLVIRKKNARNSKFFTPKFA